MLQMFKEMSENLKKENELMQQKGKRITDQTFGKNIKIKAPDYFLDTSLGYCVENQERYFTQGKLAIGNILQANEDLFNGISIFKFDTAQCMNLPALFIYSFDEYFYENYTEMQEIIEYCFSLRSKYNADLSPDEIDMKNLLNAERCYLYKHKLPQSIVGRPYTVYATTVYVVRNHIPKAKLDRNVYPLLILDDVPENAPEALILPRYYWTKDFKKL